MVKHVQHSHVPLEIDALAQLDRLDQREIAGVYHGIPQAIAGGIAAFGGSWPDGQGDFSVRAL